MSSLLDDRVGGLDRNQLILLVRSAGRTWRRSCVSTSSMRDAIETTQDLARTRAYVRSVALKYVRDDEDAEDVTQDAMLLAHRYRDSFRGDSRYTTWLYRVTATAALMFLRRRRRLAREIAASGETSGEDGTSWLERQPAAGDLRDALIARDQLAGMRRAVAALGEKYPVVFWKRYGE